MASNAAFIEYMLLQYNCLDQISRLNNRITSEADVATEVVNEEFTRIKKLYEDAKKRHEQIGNKPYFDTSLFLGRVKLESAFIHIHNRVAIFKNSKKKQQDSSLRPVKLRKLDLRTFSDQKDDWSGFSKRFTFLMREKSVTDEATKLKYLQFHLRGPARKFFNEINRTSTNFKAIMKVLNNRFTRAAVNEHLKALMSIKLNADSAEAINSFINKVQKTVDELKNNDLKMPVEQWDIWLVYVLVEHLDSNLKKSWEDELRSKDLNTMRDPYYPNFKDLMDFLNKQAQNFNR